MTKRIALFLVLAMVATFTVCAAAQSNVTVLKGVCKDENGKPFVGATVEIINLDNGRKVSVKTDKGGNYYTIGVTGGNYKVTLIGADGQIIYHFDNVSIRLGVENPLDVDLAKERSATESAMSKADREKLEAAKKENDKIKGVNALLLQAQQQKKDGQWDAAVATMEQAAAQDQIHDVVYASLGDAYAGDKKYPESETAWRKAIELAKPDSKNIGNYHNSLAQALLKQNKTAEAMAEYDKAAQLDPANGGMYYFNEGAVLTNQGKVDEANLAFDKAIAADPTRADAYYQKGLNLLGKATLGKDGKMVPAAGTTEALNKYLELAPEGKYAQQAKDLLASLGASVQTSFGTDKTDKSKKPAKKQQ
jgi:tetratricopeptide (TPR) repeat protein